MRVGSLRFLSVHRACRPVNSIAEVLHTPNSILCQPADEPIHFRPVDLFDPADAEGAAKLVSRERNRDLFGCGFDSSRDHFIARLDDVTIHRWTHLGYECFRIFVDRGVALSEPYSAHYKADWPTTRLYDTVNVDMAGTRAAFYACNELEPEMVLEDPVFYMLDKGATSYYHWMCEVAPRIWARDREPALAEMPMLVGDGALLPFQHQTLAMLRPARVTPFPWRCARVKRLYLSSFLSSGEVTRRLRPWFAQLRLRLGGTRLRDAPRRLYLSRHGAERRRVLNEDEVAEALRAYGFEPVTLDHRSVAEQIDLFAGAEAVVFPHGAAATNLAAAQPGTLAIECHSARLLNPTYWLLARALDLRYGIVCSGEPIEDYPDYLSDMTVDVAKLMGVIEAGLAAR